MTVTVNDKKEFIRYFLNHYQLKRRESVWILNYLLNHDGLMKNVHFVEDVRFCPRGVLLSTHCVDDVPFRFYHNNIMSTDAEKAFHHIRIHRDEPIYIELKFKNLYQDAKYPNVLEDNPFMPDDYHLSEEDKKEVDSFLNHSLEQFKVERLKKQIDFALDNKDEKEFLRLMDRFKTFN